MIVLWDIYGRFAASIVTGTVDWKLGWTKLSYCSFVKHFRHTIAEMSKTLDARPEYIAFLRDLNPFVVRIGPSSMKLDSRDTSGGLDTCWIVFDLVLEGSERSAGHRSRSFIRELHVNKFIRIEHSLVRDIAKFLVEVRDFTSRSVTWQLTCPFTFPMLVKQSFVTRGGKTLESLGMEIRRNAIVPKCHCET